MHRIFGLTRDPFAAVCDGELYWENAARAETRAAARDLLRQGRGVWVSGTRGSGRSALLSRLAEDLSAEGRPVVYADNPVATTAETFLGSLSAVVEDPGPDRSVRGLLSGAVSLYARLVEGFSVRGPVPCFPGPVSAAPEVVAELEILRGLRLLGRPLVALVLAGAGESPLPGLQTVRLVPPSPDDLRDLLAHRLACCGGAGLLPQGLLEPIAQRARDFDEALALGRRALSREAYCRGFAARSPEPPPSSLFRPADLDEVARLLDSLGPDLSKP
ncbi:MAG: hypothetical protein HZB55_18330 [Deltaproteobacteria bacterium]|nr:hypothetical protein [Deltaproteobacteria bacterium]